MTLTWPRFHIHRSILSLNLFWNPNYSLSQSQPSWNGHELFPFPPDDLRLASSQVVLLLPPPSADPCCQGSPAASILPSGVRVSVNLSFFQFSPRGFHAVPLNSLIANLFHGQIPQCRAAGGASKEGGEGTTVVDDWWTGSCRGCSATLQYFYCSPPLAARTTFTTWKFKC